MSWRYLAKIEEWIQLIAKSHVKNPRMKTITNKKTFQ